MAFMYGSVINSACGVDLLRRVRAEGAVPITGGPEELVIMTRGRYDSMLSELGSAEAVSVGIGLRDIEEGRVIPAEEVMAGLEEEFDLHPDNASRIPPRWY